MSAETRLFQCKVNETLVKGTVTRGLTEIQDYRVEVQIHDRLYWFDMRLVSIPPKYVVPVYWYKGRIVAQSTVSNRDDAEVVFDLALRELVDLDRQLNFLPLNMSDKPQGLK